MRQFSYLQQLSRYTQPLSTQRCMLRRAISAAELAIGNIVRRVLHMIREEAQQESAEAAEQAGLDHRLDLDHEHELDHEQHLPQPSTPRQAGGKKAGSGAGQGLLSRALRPTVLANRALSLHNLLDQSVVPMAAAIAAVPNQVSTQGVARLGNRERPSVEPGACANVGSALRSVHRRATP